MRTFKYIGIALMAIMLAAGLPAPPKASAQPGVSVSFSMFFNSLSPYGRWSNHPQYGSVWIPSAGPDFHPYYTGGRWVMTEYGNTWLSDYEWGWAPFHYGRWFYDDYLGWAWVPDYTWGPGWVNWRTGGGYYGWAPLMPGIQVRVAINLPFNFWVFIPQRHFMSRNWYRYSVPRTQVTNIYHQTTIINNYYNYNNHEYAYGPRSSDIQRHTNSRVDVYNYSSRANNGSYRESAVRTSTASARKAIEVRERNFDNGPAVANTGSARSSGVISSDNGRGSSARTSSPATNPRSANPISSPATRDNGGSAPSPRTGRTTSPESSSRYGTGTAGTSSRESVSTPERSRVSTPPAQRSGTERTAPVNEGRSPARESISTGRSSAPREAVSGSRSSSPSGRTSAPAPSERSGRSSSGERRGRQ
ncbi:MAG: hypothetical protein ABS46_01635 [Cytophagaceae bacterium SCN 52-12]|nr:MAG: hypothetical protein ABS46_01635 [Cytophagaceae bacterium SCN 52-12]